MRSVVRHSRRFQLATCQFERRIVGGASRVDRGINFLYRHASTNLHDMRPDAQRPDDFFRFFSLPHKFMIDTDALHTVYHEIMKHSHPDMQRQIRQTEGTVSPTLDPSVVTHAYQTLKRPHLRAMHLLELLGHPLDQEETSSLQGDEFLMEIMELRHDIESASSDVTLKPFFDANVQRMLETCQRLDAAIENQNINEAWRLTGELQYWNRIDETLREKMESLDA